MNPRPCSRLVMLAAIGLLVAGPALAADGLFLSWGDCPAGASPAAVRNFACDTDVGTHELFCSLTSAVPIDSVLGVEIVVDVQHSASTLPDWWRFDSQGCRFDLLRGDDNFAGHTGCNDLWGGDAVGGVLSYTVGMPRGGANQARIRVALSVLPSLQKTINTLDMHHAARIVMSNVGTLSQACSGCGGAACLVLNSIIVRRPPRPEGAPSGDVLITTPGDGNGNWVGWQILSPPACLAVPVRNQTWGAIKSLYR